MVSGVADIIIVSIFLLFTNSCQFSVAISILREFFNSFNRLEFVSAIYNLSTSGLSAQALALIPPHHPVPITPTLI